MEIRLEQSEKDKKIMREKMTAMETQMNKMTELVNSIFEKEKSFE